MRMRLTYICVCVSVCVYDTLHLSGGDQEKVVIMRRSVNIKLY